MQEKKLYIIAMIGALHVVTYGEENDHENRGVFGYSWKLASTEINT